MCKGRTHARICLQTVADLRGLIESIEAAEARGHIKRWWAGEHLSMADMIAELVRRENAHRARAAAARIEAKSRRRNARRAADALAVGERQLLSGDYDLAVLD